MDISAVESNHESAKAAHPSRSLPGSPLNKSRASAVSAHAKAGRSKTGRDGRRNSIGAIPPHNRCDHQKQINWALFYVNPSLTCDELNLLYFPNRDIARIFKTPPASAPAKSSLAKPPAGSSWPGRWPPSMPMHSAINASDAPEAWLAAMAQSQLLHWDQVYDQDYAGRAMPSTNAGREVMQRLHEMALANHHEHAGNGVMAGIQEVSPAEGQGGGFSSDESEDGEHGLHELSSLLAKQIRRSRSARHRRDPSACLSEAEQVNISSSAVESITADTST
eukprot:scaffold650734_cov48-Prasinocladus_malaysianus.AAC.1